VNHQLKLTDILSWSFSQLR